MSYEWVTKAGNVQDDDDAAKRTVRRIFIADLLFLAKIETDRSTNPLPGLSPSTDNAQPGMF